MNDICIVYITSSGKKEALEIAHLLVKENLAACVNIYDNVTSVYKWDKEVKEDPEAVLFVKTVTRLVSRIKETVKKIHSYSCPCIVTIPVADADKDFADWIINCTKEG